MLILSIALPIVLRRCFDYLPPVDASPAALKRLLPGVRVRVPFGRRVLVGVIVARKRDSGFPMEKLKAVTEVLDETPLLSSAVIELAHWMSGYYHHAVGEALVGTLPRLLRLGRVVDLSVDDVQEEGGVVLCGEELALNDDQRVAVDAVVSAKGFGAFLLDGVTGSGKTEVYLQVIAQVLAAGKQALVLIPEISLTPQTIARFEARFDVPMVILHSGLTDKQRMLAWLDARSGQAKIVIGTRSAVFTPLKALGLIILDEEHDASFKQQSGLRYSARDVAVMRASREKTPIVLGSATPAFESLHNAQQGRYQHLHLPKRAAGALQPSFQVIDMRGKRMVQGLSKPLLDVIKQHLLAQGQVLLFLNRRGYAPILLCHRCGWHAECEHCDAKLTFHQASQQLRCHHCSRVYKLSTQCPKCSADELLHLGLGTERLEKTLQTQFPGVPLVRIDSDTTRKKGSLQALLAQVHTGEARLMIGTQMLSKGHHFAGVTLVAVVDADCGLLSTDFRAMEHLAQLLLQVSGRAGRAEKPGTVVIQTHHPEHPLLQQLLQTGYGAFAQQALPERQAAQLPPFAHLALLRAEAKQESRVMDFLTQISEQITARMSDQSVVRIYGPIPAVMARRQGYHRAQILCQSTHRAALGGFLSEMIALIESMSVGLKVRWSLDVDPIEVT